MTAFVALLYIAFAVAANLIVNDQGPSSVIYVAFVLVGPVLTLRDFLHKRWEDLPRLGFFMRMISIIAMGSLLTYIAAPSAGDVAKASFIAFFASELCDMSVFALLRHEGTSTRTNASNVISAAVDSLLFPTIAFGSILWAVSYQQWVAKISGGVIWLLLWHFVRPEPKYDAKSYLRDKLQAMQTTGDAPALRLVSDARPEQRPSTYVGRGEAPR